MYTINFFLSTIESGELTLRWGLHLSLPLSQMAVGKLVDERKAGHREDVVYHLHIAAEGLHEVVPDTGHVRHPIQKPKSL